MIDVKLNMEKQGVQEAKTDHLLSQYDIKIIQNSWKTLIEKSNAVELLMKFFRHYPEVLLLVCGFFSSFFSTKGTYNPTN